MKGIHMEANKVNTNKGKIYEHLKYYIQERRKKRRKFMGIDVDKNVASNRLGH